MTLINYNNLNGYMGIIATNKNQVTLIYNSASSLGKQTLAYLQSSNMDIQEIDTTQTKIPATQWVEIAKKLNLEVSQLIEKKHPDFSKAYDEKVELKTEDWLKVINKYPQVVVSPILILGENYYKIETPSEVSDYLQSKNRSRTRNPRSN